MDSPKKDGSLPGPSSKGKPKYKWLDPLELVEGPSMEEVVELMKCSVCKRFPLRQPSSCKEGHCICFDCVIDENSSRQGKCPVEQCGHIIISADPGALWKLYLNSTYRCPNIGCEAILPGREIGLHTEFCDFRVTVLCKVTDCPVEDVMPLPLYVKHISEVHRIPVVVSVNPNRCQVVLPSRSLPFPNVWICGIFEAFENKFAILVKEHKDGFNFYGFVSADDHKDSFRIRFEVSSTQDNENFGARWSGSVLPITKSISEVEKVGASFFLGNLVVFHKLLGDQDSFGINIWIEEAKPLGKLHSVFSHSKVPYPFIRSFRG